MRQIEETIQYDSLKDTGKIVFTEKKRCLLRDLDPRLKIVISVSLSTMLFFTAQVLTVFCFVILVSLIFLLSEKGKACVSYIAAYAFCAFIIFLTAFFGNTSLKILLGVFLYSVMKFIPVVMLGNWLISTVRISDFIATMEKMGISRTIVIPLTVLFRFVPTVKEELGYIRDTMKMRNIELSCKGLVFYPMRTMEYVLVPLLLRSVKISDELSAAALTRGIDGPNKRTSLREVRILFPDLMLMAFFIFTAALLGYLDQQLSVGFGGTKI